MLGEKRRCVNGAWTFRMVCDVHCYWIIVIVQPGTYDSLAHLHFEPPPTPGSSGGPIIDEESGSVIGVILGTQLVNQVEGVRGWGVPAEMIFEVSLPGCTYRSSLANVRGIS